LTPLLRTLVRPYRPNLFFILLAMLVQTVMSLAAPWPLKIVLDNVVGSHRLPSWLDDVLKPVLAGSSKMQIAAAAAIMVVAIALVGALASYVANYYTESVGQWVANDLRMRTYHQLERLSLGYFDRHQTGAQESRQLLRKAGVDVIDSNPAFDLTHENRW
jgi:ABC-type multidrug transport system fused ATPase/permease subunit